MKRQLYYGIIFLLAGGMLLTTCNKDYFDLDKLSDEIELEPELVAPLALYLVSEQCPVSGNIYNVGMGCFNRAAMVTGPGAVVGDAGGCEQHDGGW